MHYEFVARKHTVTVLKVSVRNSAKEMTGTVAGTHHDTAPTHMALSVYLLINRTPLGPQPPYNPDFLQQMFSSSSTFKLV
jgi:hypothetical protein